MCDEVCRLSGRPFLGAVVSSGERHGPAEVLSASLRNCLSLSSHRVNLFLASISVLKVVTVFVQRSFGLVAKKNVVFI